MKKRTESIMGMAFFGPALVLLTIFLFLPMILTLIFSFTDFFALNPGLTHFVGLDNYIQIFKDDVFSQAFFNTVKFVIIIVPLQGIGALVMALPSIAIMSAWQGMGYQMIIFLGGIQAINPALYEAAEMDHATPWQKFKDITLPELKPLCVFVLITITIGAFRMLVQPMVMTGGGPSNSTYTVVYDIYETGTVNWEIGLASTMAIVFAFFVMILTVIQTIATRDKEDQNVNKKAKKK